MSNNISNSVRGIIVVWLDAAKSATADLRQSFLLVPAALVLWLLAQGAARLLSPFGMAGGMLTGLLWMALLSVYYHWLEEIQANRPLRLRTIANEFDTSLFISFINTAFILWIAGWIISSLTAGLHVPWISAGFNLLVVLLCNCLPEVIYLRRQDGLLAFKEAAAFTQQNWVEWYLPFLLPLTPLLLLSPQALVLLMASVQPLLPVSIIVTSFSLLGGASLLGNLLALCAGIIVVNWFMCFRGRLFRQLAGGSRRQRAFAARLR